MGDLEQLFQEQLASLAQDVAEHETAKKKGKAVATDPSIIVLEEDQAVEAPTKPDELITLQPGGESRWFVQHMPHLGNVGSGSTLISRQPDVSLASTPEHAKEVTTQQIPVALVPQAAPQVAALAQHAPTAAQHAQAIAQ